MVATDAPLLPDQLKRLARRASLGLARTGSISGNGSGDLFIAFSTANPGAANPEKPTQTVQTVPNDRLDPIFEATVPSGRGSDRECAGQQPRYDRSRRPPRRQRCRTIECAKS